MMGLTKEATFFSVWRASGARGKSGKCENDRIRASCSGILSSCIVVCSHVVVAWLQMRKREIIKTLIVTRKEMRDRKNDRKSTSDGVLKKIAGKRDSWIEFGRTMWKGSHSHRKQWLTRTKTRKGT